MKLNENLKKQLEETDRKEKMEEVNEKEEPALSDDDMDNVTAGRNTTFFRPQ